MSRTATILIAAGVGVLSIGLGVIIGYFSHPDGDNKAPSWTANVETYFKDVDHNNVASFVERIDADNIRKNLMFFADQPHMATSPRDVELAEYIKDEWSKTLDEAYLNPYEIFHGFVSDDPNKPNVASVIGTAGEVFFETRTTEIVYEEYMKNPENIVPYYNTFSPPGDVKGKLVFANYGNEDDYEALLNLGVNLTGVITIVKYGGGAGRGDKSANAAPYGAVGVLVYSDPNDYVVDGEVGYPEDSSMPRTGVQRGSAKFGFGDQTTPDYPSTHYVYRLPMDKIDTLIPLPLQPIAYEDAEFLISNLGGPAAPESFSTGLNVGELHVGAGFSSPNETREVHLIVNNRYEIKESNNVIGIIRGSEEPDKYVMYGNHRDSWVYGAVDPGSGTACMMEVTRVMGELLQSGWRPRRTIVFGSWGSEEFGLLGSTEWVEDNFGIFSDRAVSYINVDIAVFANQSFYAAGSPLISQVLFDAADKIIDFNDNSLTAKQVWQDNFPNEAENNPTMGRLSTGSDYAPFYHLVGVTAADLSYRGNRNKDPRYNISPYPVYHTAYDTFDYVDRFVDPGFYAHQAVSRIAGSAVILLSDSLIIPFSLLPMSDYIQTQIQMTSTNFEEAFSAKDISLDYLRAAGIAFNDAVDLMQEHIISKLDRSDPKSINLVNERLLALEKAFIEPKGLPNEPRLRHISGSPARLSGSSGSFPGIQDAMFEIESDPDQEGRWEIVKQQLAVVTYRINSAARLLTIKSI